MVAGKVVAAVSAAEVQVDPGKFQKKILSLISAEKVSQKVSEIEKHTQGEVIPIIVQSSFSARSGRWYFFSLFLGLALILLLEAQYLSWDFSATFVWILSLYLLAVFFLSHFMAKSGFWVRLLVPRSFLEAEVFRRAELEFFRAQAFRTKKRTGVFLFISWNEHQALVYGDEGISNKLPQETWDVLIENLLRSFSRGQYEQGILSSLEACGQILKLHFPADPSDESSEGDELPNGLLIRFAESVYG